MLLDTSIIIAFLRGKPVAESLLLTAKTEPLFTSALCVAELYEGVYHASNVKKTARQVEAVLEMCADIYEFTQIESRVYGQLRSELRKQGITVASVDMMIAATCISHQQPLATLNTKDFVHIPGLELVSFK